MRDGPWRIGKIFRRLTLARSERPGLGCLPTSFRFGTPSREHLGGHVRGHGRQKKKKKNKKIERQGEFGTAVLRVFGLGKGKFRVALLSYPPLSVVPVLRSCRWHLDVCYLAMQRQLSLSTCDVRIGHRYSLFLRVDF